MLQKKVVLITNIPNQYRVPLFNELNRQLIEKGIQLHIIFGASGYKFRKSVISKSEFQFSYTILEDNFSNESTSNKIKFSYKGLYKELKKQKADQIIVAGFAIATLKVWLRSWFKSTPYIIWSGTIDIGKNKIGLIKSFTRRILVKRALAYLAYGSLAKKYFISLGARSENVTIIGNTVDVTFFKEETEKIRKNTKYVGKKVLTYLGYIYPGKNIKPLMLMVEQLSKLRNDFVLEVVGDGESRAEMEKLVKDKKIQKFVQFYGFKQKHELPNFLARSSCLLFQTELDVWGLVLNEAMASGVLCIASINAGATEDLIAEGKTGFKVNFNEVEKVTNQINYILSNPKQMVPIAQEGKSLILSQYSIEECAKRVTQAVSE